MNKDKSRSIKIDNKIYKEISRLSKEQKRDLKVIIELAVEHYARISKGWEI